MASRYDLQGRIEIGKGTFGKVYKVKDKIDDKYVAIKSVSNFEASQKEVSLLKECKSPFIVSFFGIIEQDFSVLIIMEYCSNGSLMDILKKVNKSMNEDKIKKVMKDILRGLEYLHQKNILHRDVKPDNILLGDDNNYKLTDFGVSKCAVLSTAKTRVGTPLYMAPELVTATQNKYNSKCDIYSIGITVIHLFIYSDPNMIKDIVTIQQMMANNNINSLKTTNKYFRIFIKKCIQKNNAQRVSATDLLTSDPFITGNYNQNDHDQYTFDDEKKEIECNNCNGKGTIFKSESYSTYQPCGSCGGSGGRHVSSTKTVRRDCIYCDGTGREKYVFPEICRRCNGTGIDPLGIGTKEFQSKCGGFFGCGGTGRRPKPKCSECSGRGYEMEEETSYNWKPCGCYNGQTMVTLYRNVNVKCNVCSGKGTMYA